MEIGDRHRMRRLRFAFRIGFTDHLAAANAAARQRHTEAHRPVIAASQRVDCRRPAELAAAKHDRPLQAAALAKSRISVLKAGSSVFNNSRTVA